MSTTRLPLIVKNLRRHARDLRAEAARFDEIADQVEMPPEGVSIYYNGDDILDTPGGAT